MNPISWSNKTAIKPYLLPPLVKPIGAPTVHAIAIGPQELNASNGFLLSRYWMVQQENGQVKISGSLL